MKLTDEQLQQLRTPPNDNVRSAYLTRQAFERMQINAIIDELLAARKVVEALLDVEVPSPFGSAAARALIALQEYKKVTGL
jgi:hypothetical protein